MSASRVLVVDDNADLAENVAEILSGIDSLNIECELAGSGAAALAVARKHGPALDLLLVDRRLPDVDGLDLVTDLRRTCPLAEAIIITGDAKVESAAAAVGQGVFAYLLKPFEPADLLAKVGGALARQTLVSERETLRAQLEESERRYREVVEAVPAFVTALDPDGTIRLWNRRLEEVTGFARQEMLGKPGRDLLGTGGDRRLGLKSGGRLLIRWQLAEVPGPRSGPTTLAVGIDVTEERTMQRRTAVAERLAAVGTLAAGLAHEVRNPLNSASLQLQVLRRRLERGQNTPATLLPVVDIVHDEIGRLDRLVSDFLAFARPNPLALKTAELSELVQSVAVQLRPEAEARGVTINAGSPGARTQIEGDPERLRQVLINLMRNALEATATAGGSVNVGVTDGVDGFVEVFVEDTGHGFADDAPIFDAFYTTKEAGTGLGLAIVHRIVNEHGGTIHAESRPGRTRFTLRFPGLVGHSS
ncbi:MAG: response regulator [Myxococcales bacterium]|nr:response regulator [Myxococcales bacterium]